MNWIKKLKVKWQIENNWQFVIIMLVFACTGTTVVLVKQPLITFFFPTEQPLWFKIGYWVMILPFYNSLLLLYGAMFGQFRFFWNYEKKMINRFRKKNKN